jgi:arsenate reductase (glutaredoxin)
LKKADLKPFDVLRKGETVFKELNLSKDMPDDEIIRAILENPSLLQRPIVEVGDRAVLARPAEKALELIKSAR